MTDGTAYTFSATFQRPDLVTLASGQVLVSYSDDPDHP